MHFSCFAWPRGSFSSLVHWLLTRFCHLGRWPGADFYGHLPPGGGHKNSWSAWCRGSLCLSPLVARSPVGRRAGCRMLLGRLQLAFSERREGFAQEGHLRASVSYRVRGRLRCETRRLPLPTRWAELLLFVLVPGVLCCHLGRWNGADFYGHLPPSGGHKNSGSAWCRGSLWLSGAGASDAAEASCRAAPLRSCRVLVPRPALELSL